MLLLHEDEILEIGKKALAGKLPLAIHAIGDRANREVINALTKLIQIKEPALISLFDTE